MSRASQPVKENKVLKGSEAIMIPTKSGKKFLLMLDGYTYSQINYSPHWFCSSKMAGCGARVRRVSDGQVMRVNTNHTHPPPKYVVKNGMYIKI
ncbi:uncharacterized protein LOC121725426 [Aricia agestis]|uniref:uncharacterized protein LOC121725426 n=1 Tax=Aricia agestis TaxID=91739 RepID=UPI001C206C8C|nr:uncharacterized protein LOC121725426 [Aricia agestis]